MPFDDYFDHPGPEPAPAGRCCACGTPTDRQHLGYWHCHVCAGETP